jgi:hypothetical protein
MVFGWFVPKPPVTGPYFWPALPPGYALLPIKLIQAIPKQYLPVYSPAPAPLNFRLSTAAASAPAPALPPLQRPYSLGLVGPTTITSAASIAAASALQHSSAASASALPPASSSSSASASAFGGARAPSFGASSSFLPHPLPSASPLSSPPLLVPGTSSSAGGADLQAAAYPHPLPSASPPLALPSSFSQTSHLSQPSPPLPPPLTTPLPLSSTSSSASASAAPSASASGSVSHSSEFYHAPGLGAAYPILPPPPLVFQPPPPPPPLPTHAHAQQPLSALAAAAQRSYVLCTSHSEPVKGRAHFFFLFWTVCFRQGTKRALDSVGVPLQTPPLLAPSSLALPLPTSFPTSTLPTNPYSLLTQSHIPAPSNSSAASASAASDAPPAKKPKSAKADGSGRGRGASKPRGKVGRPRGTSTSFFGIAVCQAQSMSCRAVGSRGRGKAVDGGSSADS